MKTSQRLLNAAAMFDEMSASSKASSEKDITERMRGWFDGRATAFEITANHLRGMAETSRIVEASKYGVTA
tara:strand:+ start:326 stop:538 length:213 start_codon:yes stop_codon:yes gene_type:complete